MVSFEELLALLLQLVLQSLVHSVLQPSEQLSLHDEHPELVLLLVQLLEQVPLQTLVHPSEQELPQPVGLGLGSLEHDESIGVVESSANPNMGRVFSVASLKNSLRD